MKVFWCTHFSQNSNFWPLNIRPSLSNLINRLIFIISANKVAHMKSFFQESPLNSEIITDSPTFSSKKSVPAVLPAVAETLDPLHILGTGLLWRGETTISNKDKFRFRYRLKQGTFEWALVSYKYMVLLLLLLLLSVGLPVASAPDVLQPCGLLHYPWCSNSHHQSSPQEILAVRGGDKPYYF